MYLIGNREILFRKHCSCSPSAMPFSSLPVDILVFHVVQYLDAIDVVHLAQCCRRLHRLLSRSNKEYLKFLPREYFFDSFYRWGPSLYELRQNSELRVYASKGGCWETPRWGHFPSLMRSDGLKWKRTKQELCDPVGKISEIGSCGLSCQLLTSEGRLYYTGKWWWHDSEAEYWPGPVYPDNLSPFPYWRSELVEVTANQDGSTRFLAVSSGNLHFIALDSCNTVWTWDDGRQARQGVPLQLVESVSGVPICGQIRQIHAGWNLSSCFVEGVGIVVWRKRQNVTGWRDGRPVHDNNIVQAAASIIPGTTEVSEYAVLKDAVVYVKEGSAYSVTIQSPEFSWYEGEIELLLRLAGKNEDTLGVGHVSSIVTVIGRLNVSEPLPFEPVRRAARIVRISAFYTTLVLLTADHAVLVAQMQSGGRFRSLEWVEDLRDKSVVSVAVGKSHLLALTESGELYCWGEDYRIKGCLAPIWGNVEATNTVFYSRGGIRARRPVLARMCGKVIALAASDHQTVILVGHDTQLT